MNDEILERYSRQILLPEIDFEGQEALHASCVAIIGCGGLGSLIALYLVGAGVGRVKLFDDDEVELSNLHRQLAFRETDLGASKAVALREHLLQVNGTCHIDSCHYRFGKDQKTDQGYLASVDLVLDATDNLGARHAIEVATRALSIPWIMGAATRFHGQVAAFNASRSTGCYRCMAPSTVASKENDCRNEGVLGPVVGVVAAWQAQDAILALAGKVSPLWGVLRVYDALAQRIDKLSLASANGCRHG